MSNRNIAQKHRDESAKRHQTQRPQRPTSQVHDNDLRHFHSSFASPLSQRESMTSCSRLLRFFFPLNILALQNVAIFTWSVKLNFVNPACDGSLHPLPSLST